MGSQQQGMSYHYSYVHTCSGEGVGQFLLSSQPESFANELTDRQPRSLGPVPRKCVSIRIATQQTHTSSYHLGDAAAAPHSVNHPPTTCMLMIESDHIEMKRTAGDSDG